MNIIDAIKSGKSFKRRNLLGWYEDGLEYYSENRDPENADTEELVKDVLADDWEVLICEKCHHVFNIDAPSAGLGWNQIRCYCKDDDCKDTGCTCNPTVIEAQKALEEAVGESFDPPVDWDSYGPQLGGIAKKCECGSDAIKGGSHATYCPKFKEMK